MNIFITGPWPLAFSIGILFCTLVLAGIRLERRQRKDCRDMLLESSKNNIIPLIMSDAHPDGAALFRVVEDRIMEYDFSEEDLGVSMHKLLPHAIVCGKKKVASLQAELSDIRKGFDDIKEKPLEDWQKMWTSVGPDMLMKLDELDDLCQTITSMEARYSQEAGYYRQQKGLGL